VGLVVGVFVYVDLKPATKTNFAIRTATAHRTARATTPTGSQSQTRTSYTCGPGRSQSKLVTHTHTTASGTVVRCSTGGSMYSEMVANHTPYRIIVQMLSGIYVHGVAAEYKRLRQEGVPPALAHKLALKLR